MTVGPLVIDIVAVCCLTAFLLHRYGNWRKQHLLVTLATFISWYFSLLIVFMLPLDVSTTFYRQCLEEQESDTTPFSNITGNISAVTEPTLTTQNGTTLPWPTTTTLSPNTSHSRHSRSADECEMPWSHIPDGVLSTLWVVVYWTSQALTWLILPMMQSYANAGDFTVAGKIKSALIENAIFYGSYLLIFGVCLIYVAARPDIHLDGAQLKVICVTASNTWGLFLLVLLFGYGLVEVPRTLWHNSIRGHMLSQTYFKLAKLSTEKSEAEESLEDVLEDIKKASESVRYNHPLRHNVDTVLKKCPETFQKVVKRGNMDDFQDYEGPSDIPTEKHLVRLHKKVINAVRGFHRTKCQWNMLIERAFELEDVATNMQNSDRRFRSSTGKYNGFFKLCYSPTLEWIWKCRLRPWVLKALAIILAIFSCMVVWSEVTFFNKKPVLSLFAIFINLAKEHYTYLYIELASFITISYLCLCAYYTVFKVRVFNYYYLASHHQTDENSLLFCGILLCRLTPPLCLNFLSLIHLDSHVIGGGIPETQYTKIMGHMDVISFISNGFNIYFPIAIVLLCIFTYFNVGTRCLHFIGFQQFVGDDDMTQDLIDEGRELARREHRKMVRQQDSEARRRYWNERFGDPNASGASDSDTVSNRRPAGKSTEKVKSVSSVLGKKLPPLVAQNHNDDSDRTGLLRQAEPIDYTEENFEDFTPGGSVNSWQGDGGYQSQTASSGSRFNINRPSNRPPKGIFDDI